jgi:aryl-alcohol dehydrogenase-like predicted oxidoreductase
MPSSFPLQTRTLGRTGLQVTLAGLGCGGNSRLGLATGHDLAHAASVVRAALEMGVTIIDTARYYQTEPAVGMALHHWRAGQARPVISSKAPYLDDERKLLTPDAFRQNLETSLRELKLEAIDIYLLHGLTLPYYEACCETLLPVLEQAKRDGKVRFFGASEAFESDTRHELLQRLVQDDIWDVVMVGFNLVNPSARERVLAVTQKKGIATLGMFAVRRGLIDEAHLRRLVERLVEMGEVDPVLATEPDLMDSLGLRGICDSLSEAAYRFAAFEPGLDCVLIGTGSASHLQQNLQAILKGPLPASALARLEQLFGKIDSVSAQLRTT